MLFIKDKHMSERKEPGFRGGITKRGERKGPLTDAEAQEQYQDLRNMLPRQFPITSEEVDALIARLEAIDRFANVDVVLDGVTVGRIEKMGNGFRVNDWFDDDAEAQKVRDARMSASN